VITLRRQKNIAVGKRHETHAVDAEREHMSGVVQMTNGIIAGEGGAAEVLGNEPV
jgi:hypothetical protein